MYRVVMLPLNHEPRLQLTLNLFAAFYGIWNLDIGRSLIQGICIKTSTLAVTALELVVGIYPLLLIFLTYLFVHLYDQNFKVVVFAVKPFHLLFRLVRRNMQIRTSLIDAFSTFFLLSSMKLLSVCFDLLAPVKVHILEPSGALTSTYRLYFNADVAYFGEFHLPYPLLAVAIIICFVLLPFCVLILYPLRLCQKFLDAFPLRCQLILHTFVDTFQGCFKDGTEPGSRDYRWFSVVILLTRFLLFSTYAATLNMMYFVFASMLLVFLCILIIIFQPYKDNTRQSFFSVLYFLYLSCFYLSVISGNISVGSNFTTYASYIIAVIFGSLPLVHITCLVVNWLIQQTSISKAVQMARAWCGGCDIL